jgi:protein gp37
MGKDSRIEWTHHTFNPWWGCVKVSPACKHCYAEAWAKRVGLEVWGARTSRRFFSDAHWREPLKWNRDAAVAGERRRVFCASMADVFEPRHDLNAWRERLWPLIEATPFLDWLLLTKRPEYVGDCVPWGRRWPPNVWLGTTVENQHWAEKRLPILVEYPAVVRFASCEPLLGALDLRRWLRLAPRRLDWVIAGGESGHKARPMNPSWVRALRDECTRARVPFHFKQWGHWRPDDCTEADLRTRAIVKLDDGARVTLVRLGKHATGRDLDGETWDGLPYPSTRGEQVAA